MTACGHSKVSQLHIQFSSPFTNFLDGLSLRRCSDLQTWTIFRIFNGQASLCRLIFLSRVLSPSFHHFISSIFLAHFVLAVFLPKSSWLVLSWTENFEVSIPVIAAAADLMKGWTANENWWCIFGFLQLLYQAPEVEWIRYYFSCIFVLYNSAFKELHFPPENTHKARLSGERDRNVLNFFYITAMYRAPSRLY